MPIEAQTALALLQQGAEHVARNPLESKTTVKRWLRLLQNKKPRVLVAGNKSAGKTILADFLSGLAYKQGYRPPGVSNKVETSKVPGNPTLMLETVPGDRSVKRSIALHKLGAGKTKIDGVLHVLANGYSLPRGELARDAALERHPTLAFVWGKERIDSGYDRATMEHHVELIRRQLFDLVS